jgi:hypothetical protein
MTSQMQEGPGLALGPLPAREPKLGSFPRAEEAPVPHTGGMELIVCIDQGEDGRPVGTVRAAGTSETRSFSGNLEFLALVENLYRRADRQTTPPRKSTKGTDDV